MAGQIQHYKERGFDLSGPLVAGGFWIVEISTLMACCFDDWWDDILRLSIIDQLSLPVSLKRHNIVPEIIEGNIWVNYFIRVEEHSKMM
ncbi:hypothetical protein [Methylobacterium brachiatum]|uniref:hypothetical protein n=1 Tax=Methylobacterium brachiatum TaxID=269660 RepID=UPI000EFC5FAF|nr:hypothetical protein [Methylobacterium brachiatum]AYO81807.1 hypothetical protein EBB05_05685 [Methylobacterium brachiatum]